MTNRENCSSTHVVINFLLSFTTVYNKTVCHVRVVSHRDKPKEKHSLTFYGVFFNCYGVKLHFAAVTMLGGYNCENMFFCEDRAYPF